MSSLFKKDKKKEAKAKSAKQAVVSPKAAPRKTASAKSSPALGNAKPDPTKASAPTPRTPGPSHTKKADDDDFWGTTEKQQATPSPMSGGMGGGMPSPSTYSNQLSVPPGYIFNGFALDQFGQTVMVLVNALSGQPYYQPVSPSIVQQYTGYSAQGGTGSPMAPSQPAYPPTGYSGGPSMSYPSQPSFGSSGYYGGGAPSYGSQPPTGYPPQTGYPSTTQTNGGGYSQPTTQPSYPSTPQPSSGGYGQPATQLSYPPSSAYPPQGYPTGYPQGYGATGLLSPQPDTRGRSASCETSALPQPQFQADGKPLAQSADAPVPVPPRPAHLQNRTPTMKREILINQHKFGEEFGKLSVMREARRKAREEEKKKTGGIKVLPTIKNPKDRKEEERKRKEAIKKAEEERRKRDLEAKIQREAEERARFQEEAMLRDIEEKVKREEEERRRAWEEEMRRNKAEEERKWAEEEAKILAQLEDEKRKRLEAEEKIKHEKEKKKRELEELQKAREHQMMLEQQLKQEQEQKALQERIEKEKNWAKQSFNPEAFRKAMEQKLREEMEKQLREEQERLRRAETMAWEVRPEDVTTDKELGKGAFGMVYSGKLRGKRVAIKTILVENINEENIASFKKEVDIMTKLRHPNILLFMGACFQPGHFMLITELMPKGSLDKIIHEKKEPLTFKQRMQIARDTALGMNWLHSLSPPLLHLDLKLGNLLVDEGWNVKVADFGLSKMKSDCVTEDEGFIGSPFYMAPEMLQEKEYNEKADVYSFGIVLWELYTMQSPYEGRFNSLEEFIDAIVGDEERPPLPPDCPTTLHNLIESCWQTNPNDRPTFARILDASLFECIIVEEIVKDYHGRAFWMEKFLEQDVVDWPEFLEAYCDFFHIDPESLAEGSPNTKAFKAVLVPPGKESVTLEAFGACLAWFGPLQNGFTLVSNLVAMVCQPWFHGKMTREESELQLKPKKEGTYLVRFSADKPGSFTVSIKHQKKKFVHLRISRTPEGSFEYNKQFYPSIDEFMQAHKGQLNLKSPCSGSPFVEIFGKPASSQNGSHAYAGDEQYTNAEYGNFGQLTFS